MIEAPIVAFFHVERGGGDMVSYSEMVAEAHAYARSNQKRRGDVFDALRDAYWMTSDTLHRWRDNGSTAAERVPTVDELDVLVRYFRCRAEEFVQAIRDQHRGLIGDLTRVRFYRRRLHNFLKTARHRLRKLKSTQVRSHAYIQQAVNTYGKRETVCVEKISALKELKSECESLVEIIREISAALDEFIHTVRAVSVISRMNGEWTRIHLLKFDRENLHTIVVIGGILLVHVERNLSEVREEILPDVFFRDVVSSWTHDKPKKDCDVADV